MKMMGWRQHNVDLWNRWSCKHVAKSNKWLPLGLALHGFNAKPMLVIQKVELINISLSMLSLYSCNTYISWISFKPILMFFAIWLGIKPVLFTNFHFMQFKRISRKCNKCCIGHWSNRQVHNIVNNTRNISFLLLIHLLCCINLLLITQLPHLRCRCYQCHTICS